MSVSAVIHLNGDGGMLLIVRMGELCFFFFYFNGSSFASGRWGNWENLGFKSTCRNFCCEFGQQMILKNALRAIIYICWSVRNRSISRQLIIVIIWLGIIKTESCGRKRIHQLVTSRIFWHFEFCDNLNFVTNDCPFFPKTHLNLKNEQLV